MELIQKTAAQLHQLLRDREITAAEITDAVFAQIAACEPQVQSYLALTEESARRTAALVDEKLAAGEELPPLAGIPIACLLYTSRCV